MLTINKIKYYLQDQDIDIEIFESIESTNDYLKTFKNNKRIKICLAEMQTKGRGRLDRRWYSPFAKNIYLSCLYPLKKNPNELSGLSLVVGLAIHNTLKNYGLDEQLKVKWPNDVLCDGKKISGILIEVQSNQVIIGVGINVNMLEDENQISQSWTSMQKILGREIDRNELVARLLMNLFAYLSHFLKNGFIGFMTEWARVDGLLNKEVTIEGNTGKVVGVDERGCLLLQLSDGCINAYRSGELT